MLKQLTSLQHPLVKHLVKLRQNRDYRYDHQLLIVEGLKMIDELKSHHTFKTAIVDSEAHLIPGLKAQETYLVTPEMMKKISGMQAPEGLVVEMEMPKPATLKGLKKIIVLDGVGDPGNMGTLLRSALALGWEGAFIVDNSCDPFNEKTIRAARGATFRLPLAFGSWDTLKTLIKNESLDPIVADIQGKNLDEVKLKGCVALVLGNEAKGVSETAKTLCTAVTIPMPGEMESLNVSVAGGIMMYVLGGKK